MHRLPPTAAFMIKGGQIDMAVTELTKGLDKEFEIQMAAILKYALTNVLTYAYDFDLVPLEKNLKEVREYLDSMEHDPAGLQHECILALATLRHEVGVDLLSLPAACEMTKLGMPLYITFLSLIGAMSMVWLDERNGVRRLSHVRLRLLRTH